MSVYFSSDTHFNENRMGLFGRDLVYSNTDEMNADLVAKWNSVVGKDDTIYHLGDVSLDEAGLEFVKQLNGRKILVRGNKEDTFSDELLLKYFDKVYKKLILHTDTEDLFLNHYPSNGRQDMFNVTGHIHAVWKVQRNMVNVGVDAWHFKPVSMDQVKFQINGIRKYYDINVFAGELPANLELEYAQKNS